MAIKGDFISFTYNGVHSTELGIVRVSSSNRYNDSLLPMIQDKTNQVPGNDGTYFFGSNYTQRPITIDVAFDEVTEDQIRLMRATFGDRMIHQLIFDDEPYKVYYAKVTGTPQIKYIPFGSPRIYKGEGTFTFTCFDPFAHCPNDYKYLDQWAIGETKTDNSIYSFKQTGKDLGQNIGSNLYINKIIGGTIVWNQLIQDGNFPNTDKWNTVSNSSLSALNNVLTIHKDSGTTIVGGVNIGTSYRKTSIIGHKYLFAFTIQSEIGNQIALFPTGTSSEGSMEYRQYPNKTKIYWLWDCQVSKPITGEIRGYTGGGVTSTIDFTLENYMCFDLTAMFGSIIADYVYTLENNAAGAGIAWLKKYNFLEKLYYAYNAGQLISVKISAHKTVGFNLLNTFLGYKSTSSAVTFNTANAVRVINGMEYEFNHGAVFNATTWRHAVICYDLNGIKMSDSGLITAGAGGMGYNRSGGYYVNGSDQAKTSDKFTSNFDGFVVPFIIGGDASDSTTVQNPCVHFVWDGERDGDYEIYTEHTYVFDSTKEWRGILQLDVNNNLYYDGDIYPSNGQATRKYGIVDLGTLEWSKVNNNNWATFSSSSLGNIVKKPDNINNGWMYVRCSMYSGPLSSTGDNYIYLTASEGNIKIKDTSKASLSADAFKTAMSGVYFIYPLATPTMESAITYQNPQIVDSWGTEEYLSTQDVLLPVYTNGIYKADPDWYKYDNKDEWNLSANLLSAQGTYDTYVTATGFKLYNPGDVAADFYFIIPISATISGIKITNSLGDLDSHTLLLKSQNTQFTAKGTDTHICFNSKTNLIQGYKNGKRTGNIYNEYIGNGHWFQIPTNSSETYYFIPIDYSGSTPELKYDYLYY